MVSALQNRTIYEFGEFRLVPGEGLLLRNGEPVALNPKAFSVLSLLVERHGHLVSKSEILDIVWEDAFIEEGAVAKAIWFVRQALGDTSKERFIQNIPRRGYRFISPVSIVTNGSGAFRLPELFGVGEDDNGITPPGLQTANVADAEDQVELDPALPAKISRSRKFRRAAALAGVVVVLAAVSLYTAFYGSFTTKGGPLRDRGTKSEEAYDLYRQAENLSHGRIRTDLQAALDYLNQAVALDPDFARAWAAKAHLHKYLGQYPGADENEQRRKSMDAVVKALAIDPNLSEAYSTRCYHKLRYEFDVAGAEIDCKRALELDPDSAVGHQMYASFLWSRGRSEESIAEAKKAVDLQPLSYDTQQTYAIALRHARRYPEEEAQWKRLLELNPAHSFIYIRLFTNLAQQGKHDKAFEYLIEKLKVDKADNETVERFRTAYAVSGWRGVTMERIKRLETETAGPVDVACLYASIGDKDKAFEYLEKAYKERPYKVAGIKAEPQLDPLRDDPRFADLVRRVEGK